MEVIKLGNLKLYGIGYVVGGVYYYVSIKGKGVIGEGLFVVGCCIFGIGFFFGKVESEWLCVFGESECKGNLLVGRINIYGIMKVSGFF